MIQINSAAGVALHYDRLPAFPYGSKGQARSFECNPNLKTALDRACAELWHRLPEGKPDILLTAGAYVDKPGAHGSGTAFDFDGMWWGDKRFVTTDYPNRKVYYCGIQAVLMRQFGVVLNYHWPNHRDHFHIDLSAPTGWRAGGKSCVMGAQTILRDVWGFNDLAIDGRYGTKTAMAFEGIGIAPGGQWDVFLDKTIDRALGAVPVPGEPDTPRELLAAVYREAAGDEPVLAALNKFRAHPKVDAIMG